MGVDHSDTNFALYTAFSNAEYVAKKRKKGYWANHKE